MFFRILNNLSIRSPKTKKKVRFKNVIKALEPTPIISIVKT